MTRGVRGATTVAQNEATLILENTRTLVEEMIKKNSITPENVSHVFISVTNDINAGFPARSVREIHGWSLVPVVWMKEIEVPNSLEKCIRVMMVIGTDEEQDDINNILIMYAITLMQALMIVVIL